MKELIYFSVLYWQKGASSLPYETLPEVVGYGFAVWKKMDEEGYNRC